MRAAPSRAVCAGLLVTVVLTACGVEPQRAPEPVPPDRLPAASPSPSTTGVAARGRVWGAREGRLVPVFTELPSSSTRSRVRAVLSLDGRDGGPPTALRPGTRLLRLTQSDDLVVVSLSDELGQVPSADLPLALGQLVLTVTEQPGVRRVHVRVEQVPIVYVDATGRQISRALVRADFAELVQGDS